MDQIPCPDGYLLDPKSPLAEGHRALNQYLVRVEEAGWAKALKEINALRDKTRKLLVWKALIERMSWLRDNSPNNSSLSPLRGLAERVEKWTLAPTERDLIEILDRTAEAADFLAPYTPMPHLMAWVQENGLTPELSLAIRDFRRRVEEHLTVNQVSLQLFRSRLDMLAWRDEGNEIDLKRCWSEQIRADFRAMQGSEKEHWRRVLYSIDGDEGVRPAPRWLSDAETRIEAIGPREFRTRLERWLEPLQAGSVHRLSREGSFLLRSFIWLAQLLSDPNLRARVGAISQVQFKPKSNGEKVIRAAAEAAGQPDPTAKPPAPAPSLDAITARALAAALSPERSAAIAPEIAGRIRMDGGIINIRGDLDTYRVHISTGAVFRKSDGKRVHIAAEHFPVAASAVPDFGGIATLLNSILVLAEDRKHSDALKAEAE